MFFASVGAHCCWGGPTAIRPSGAPLKALNFVLIVALPMETFGKELEERLSLSTDVVPWAIRRPKAIPQVLLPWQDHVSEASPIVGASAVTGLLPRVLGRSHHSLARG